MIYVNKLTLMKLTTIVNVTGPKIFNHTPPAIKISYQFWKIIQKLDTRKISFCKVYLDGVGSADLNSVQWAD